MRAPLLPGAAALLGLAVAASLAAPLRSQTVRVRVVAGDPPRPVAGALLSLQTGRGERLTQTLSDEAGRATLAAPAPGTYRVRADRIGYSGILSDPIVVGAEGVTTLSIAMPDTRVLLPEITVRSTRRVCRLAQESGTALAAVWDEARKALTGTQLTRTVLPPEIDVTTYERDLDRRDRVTAERSSTARRRVTRPFVAPDPAGLLERGFVEERADETWIAAPDAELLLSEPFLESHCFGVVSSEADSGLVGLAFEPARGRRVPEIRGILWLHRATAELRFLEFSYVNLEDRLALGDAGGRLDFRRLPTGGWIVSEWWIRTPIVGRYRTRGFDGTPVERDSLLGRREAGGRAEVVGVEAPAGRAVLAGTVFDSTADAPLEGAVVAVAGASYADTTDERGRFWIETPTRGNFLVTASHPRIGALLGRPLTGAAGLDRGAVTTVDLAIPTLARLTPELCRDVTLAGGGPALLAGTVRDSAGTAAPGASLDLRVRGALGPTVVTVTADSAGGYRLCGLAAGSTAWLRPAGGLTPIPASIPLRDLLTVRDVSLLPRHRAGGAVALLVSVRDSASGTPVEGAALLLEASGDSARSDAEGRARVTGLRPGRHLLAIRALGYETLERELDLAAGDTTLAVALTPGAVTLAAREVEGRAAEAPRPRLAGFESRRQDRNGFFLTAEQLRARPGSPLSAVLRQASGLRLIPRPSPCSGYAAAGGRRGAASAANCQGAPFPAACYLAVYVDGSVFWREGTSEPPPDLDDFRVDDLDGIEVYIGPAQVPAAFQTTGAACGAVILWRRA